MSRRNAVSLGLIGISGGLLSGLFGVGGGIVMVPLLMALLKIDQRRASATSLIAIIPTAVVGAITYGIGGHVDYKVGCLIAVGSMIGSYIGARLLHKVPVSVLRWLFIALLVFIAVRLAFEVPNRGNDIQYEWPAVMTMLGVVTGLLAGLLGIGGGVIVVSALVLLWGSSDLLAKGTSLLAIVPAAATGTFVNVRAKRVLLSDGLVVGVAAAVASFVGAALAPHIPPRASTILFAVVLLASATQMIFRTRQRPNDDMSEQS